MNDKVPSFFQGISFQLAKIGIIVALGLGFLISSVQLYLDYHHHQKELEALIERIVEVAKPPAARAVHTLDDDLSVEVVNGLLTYDFIDEVTISDELGNVLAYGSSERSRSPTQWLTRYLMDETRSYSASLIMPGFTAAGSGTIHFTVNVDQALSGFYERSVRGLITGVLRNMLLVLLLFIVFYVLLTKPLVRLAREIKDFDPDHPGAQASAERIRLLLARRERVGGKPEGRRIGAFERVVEVAESGDRRERSERFIAHDPRAVRHFGKHRRLEEEALVAACGTSSAGQAATIQQPSSATTAVISPATRRVPLERPEAALEFGDCPDIPPALSETTSRALPDALVGLYRHPCMGSLRNVIVRQNDRNTASEPVTPYADACGTSRNAGRPIPLSCQRNVRSRKYLRPPDHGGRAMGRAAVATSGVV
jgi:hypothetical protein